MDKQQLAKWITDGLAGNKYALLPNETHDFRGEWSTVWSPIKGPDRKSYDATLTYVVNGHDIAKLFLLHADLAQCVYFPLGTNGSIKPDPAKLDQLINDIELKLAKGGNFKLEIIKDVGVISAI